MSKWQGSGESVGPNQKGRFVEQSGGREIHKRVDTMPHQPFLFRHPTDSIVRRVGPRGFLDLAESGRVRESRVMPPRLGDRRHPFGSFELVLASGEREGRS